MKTLEVGATSPSLHEVLKLADGYNVILRTADGREYVVPELDDFDREIALARHNPDLMRLLDERSREGSAVSPSEARRRSGL
jgi:hypothetical protein